MWTWKGILVGLGASARSDTARRESFDDLEGHGDEEVTRTGDWKGFVSCWNTLQEILGHGLLCWHSAIVQLFRCLEDPIPPTGPWH